jgi:hypothetical protein
MCKVETGIFIVTVTTADCSNLASRVKSDQAIAYTGTIARATTYGREQ